MPTSSNSLKTEFIRAFNSNKNPKASGHESDRFWAHPLRRRCRFRAVVTGDVHKAGYVTECSGLGAQSCQRSSSLRPSASEPVFTPHARAQAVPAGTGTIRPSWPFAAWHSTCRCRFSEAAWQKPACRPWASPGVSPCTPRVAAPRARTSTCPRVPVSPFLLPCGCFSRPLLPGRRPAPASQPRAPLGAGPCGLRLHPHPRTESLRPEQDGGPGRSQSVLARGRPDREGRPPQWAACRLRLRATHP